jgi:hypothetical protein
VDSLETFDPDRKWTVQGEEEWLIAYRVDDPRFFAQAAQIVAVFHRSAPSQRSKN